MSKSDFLRIVCAEGEGQKIEFKAKITALAKEIVAFANASGGSLFLGISDDGEIVGIDDSNRLRSQIQNVANGCDPRIDICIAPRGNVVEIIVPQGLTLEELGTRSVPRNRLIADMFHRMGYVERLGSGIHRMRESNAWSTPFGSQILTYC